MNDGRAIVSGAAARPSGTAQRAIEKGMVDPLGATSRVRRESCPWGATGWACGRGARLDRLRSCRPSPSWVGAACLLVTIRCEDGRIRPAAQAPSWIEALSAPLEYAFRVGDVLPENWAERVITAQSLEEVLG